MSNILSNYGVSFSCGIACIIVWIEGVSSASSGHGGILTKGTLYIVHCIHSGTNYTYLNAAKN